MKRWMKVKSSSCSRRQNVYKINNVARSRSSESSFVNLISQARSQPMFVPEAIDLDGGE